MINEEEFYDELFKRGWEKVNWVLVDMFWNMYFNLIKLYLLNVLKLIKWVLLFLNLMINYIIIVINLLG